MPWRQPNPLYGSSSPRAGVKLQNAAQATIEVLLKPPAEGVVGEVASLTSGRVQDRGGVIVPTFKWERLQGTGSRGHGDNGGTRRGDWGARKTTG